MEVNKIEKSDQTITKNQLTLPMAIVLRLTKKIEFTAINGETPRRCPQLQKQESCQKSFFCYYT